MKSHKFSIHSVYGKSHHNRGDLINNTSRRHAANAHMLDGRRYTKTSASHESSLSFQLQKHAEKAVTENYSDIFRFCPGFSYPEFVDVATYRKVFH